MNDKDKKDKSDWGFMDSIQKKANTLQTKKEPSSQSMENLERVSGKDASTLSPTMLKKPDMNTAKGLLLKLRENKLGRKAKLKAVEAHYGAQLDLLTHNLSRELQVKKKQTDFMAERYLREIDAMQVELMAELGIQNIETRMRTIEKLTDRVVEQCRKFQEKDWPESEITAALEASIDMKKRFMSELLTDVSLDGTE